MGRENGFLQISRYDGGEDLFFVKINILGATLKNVRVTVASIMSETHVKNFAEGEVRE